MGFAVLEPMQSIIQGPFKSWKAVLKGIELSTCRLFSSFLKSGLYFALLEFVAQSSKKLSEDTCYRFLRPRPIVDFWHFTHWCLLSWSLPSSHSIALQGRFLPPFLVVLVVLSRTGCMSFWTQCSLNWIWSQCNVLASCQYILCLSSIQQITPFQLPNHRWRETPIQEHSDGIEMHERHCDHVVLLAYETFLPRIQSCIVMLWRRACGKLWCVRML